MKASRLHKLQKKKKNGFTGFYLFSCISGPKFQINNWIDLGIGSLDYRSGQFGQSRLNNYAIKPSHSNLSCSLSLYISFFIYFNFIMVLIKVMPCYFHTFIFLIFKFQIINLLLILDLLKGIHVVRSLFATQTQNVGYADLMSPRQ